MASTTEIGRQVQESSRIATEAVNQAARTVDRISELAQVAASLIGDRRDDRAHFGEARA